MTERRGSDFADLVYRILIIEKLYGLEEVAQNLDIKYATLYGRIHKRVPFSADEIRDLIRVVPDVRLVQYFTEGSAFIAADRTEPGPRHMATVHRGATGSVLEATDVLREVEESLKDERIDHRDKARIEEEITETEQALASLRQNLEGS